MNQRIEYIVEYEHVNPLTKKKEWVYHDTGYTPRQARGIRDALQVMGRKRFRQVVRIDLTSRLKQV